MSVNLFYPLDEDLQAKLASGETRELLSQLQIGLFALNLREEHAPGMLMNTIGRVRRNLPKGKTLQNLGPLSTSISRATDRLKNIGWILDLDNENPKLWFRTNKLVARW